MSMKQILCCAVVFIAIFVNGCSSGSGGGSTQPPVTPTIVWATPASIVAGTALSATQLDATAVIPGTTTAVAGTYTYMPAAGTVESAAGNVTLSVSFAPSSPAQYNSATGSVVLAVTAPPKVTPVVSWATPATVSVDTFLTATQLDATATAPGGSTALAGTFSYSPALGAEVTSVGTQTLSVMFTPTDTTDYTTATGTVQLTVNAPSYAFTPVKIIGGGYVDRIVMHPAQKGLMYAGTDVGGAYRWDSVNSVWVPLTDFVTRANTFQVGIESIGLDASDTQRLYLAAGEYTESFGTNCALYASDNQGASFTTLQMPFKCGSNDNGRGAGERLAVDPNLGTNLLWGTRQNGLYQSTNRGVSWMPVASFPVTGATSGTGVVFEIYMPSSATSGNATQTIYAGVSAVGTATDPQCLYVTTNGGTSWSAVPGAPTGWYLSHGVLGPDGNLYFSAGDQIGPGGLANGKIFQYVVPTSSNPAGTWNDITPPRTNGYQGGYGAVALDPEKPGTIVVSTLDHYYPIGDDLWRSLNYGQTWASLNTVGLKLDDSLSPFLLFGNASTAGFGTGNWLTGLAIDPFNSDHVVYGTGATVETTSNMTAMDTGQPVNFTVGAEGIEETVITGLVSPPSGPANLLSVMGDVDGFEHLDLTVSPAAGMFQNPGESTGTGIDFAQSVPATVVRVGNGNSNSQFGGYSTNSGASWAPFATNPTGVTTGSGSVAISADGTTIVWSPGDSGVTSYSTNNGLTWTASTGAEKNVTVLADRVNAKKFYFYDSNAGVLYTSTDGGATFAATMNNVPKYGALEVSYDAEGSLYLVTSGGLYHAALGASSFSQMGGVQAAYNITQGAPAAGNTQLTLYLQGTIGGNTGLYRSTDDGVNWIRFDGPSNQYGYIGQLVGDERVFGRVYLGTGGRGILYAGSTY